MADPKNPNMSSFLPDAETLDVQRKITEQLEAQNNTIEDMVGVTKRFNLSLLDQLARQREVNQEVKNVEKELQKQRLITATQTDKAKAAESKLIEEGLEQRLTAYSKELEMLKLVNSAAIAPLLYFLKETYELFKSLDTAAKDFRMQMGFTRATAKELRNISQNIAIDFMHIGVSIKDAYTSILAITKEVGSAHTITKELVKTTAILKAQLGVSEESTAGFLRNMSSIAGTTMETQKQMAYVAANLSNAAGVPFPEIMKDIATKSERTLTMMSRLPSVIVRSAVELRKMGTDLTKAAESSRKLLDFTDNVNAEMEASVLLGHSINLQRARELAYRRDLEGSTREILKMTKNIDFSNLDVFQQEAFARATGKSVDELMNMIQAEKQWEAARKSGDPAMQARVAAYEKLRSSNAAIQKDQARQLEMMVLTRSNQERMTAISQKWQQIMAQAGEVLLPVLDYTLAIVPPLLDIAKGFAAIMSTVWTLGKGLETVAQVGATWFATTERVFNFFMKIEKVGAAFLGIFSKIMGPFSRITAFLGSWGGLVFKFLTPFLRFLGPIGWIITAFQFITNLFKRLHGIGDAFKGGILNGILFGLKAIGGALYDTILKPFVDAWNWIKGIFVGKSPSTLALGIVKGVLAIQTMLFDAITYPWRHAFAWILDKIPGAGKFAEKLRGGAGGLVKDVETKIAGPKAVANNQIATKPTAIAGTPQAAQQTAAEAQQAQSGGQKTLDDILSAINLLNKNLMDGKIGFYVDGQLLSATIARQTEFRGGYGVNKV